MREGVEEEEEEREEGRRLDMVGMERKNRAEISWTVPVRLSSRSSITHCTFVYRMYKKRKITLNATLTIHTPHNCSQSHFLRQ